MRELECIQHLGDDVLIERLTHSVRSDRQLTVRMHIEMVGGKRSNRRSSRRVCGESPDAGLGKVRESTEENVTYR